jgi:hypothetical protein
MQMQDGDKQALESWHTEQFLDEDDPPIQSPLHDLDAQTVVAMLMLICVPDQKGAILWKTAIKRLALLCHAILPEAGAKCLATLAKELTKAGVSTTKSALSVINCQLYDATGLRRTEKTDHNRETYRVRACKVWGRKADRNKK